jgi:hypothetical protein
MEKRKMARLPNQIRNIALFVAILLIFDVATTKLWSPYLRQNFPIFSGKSETTILSDLLFGEGAIFLGFGALIMAGASKTSVLGRYPGQYYKEEKMMTDYVESRPRQISAGVLLIIVGAILMGLAITVSVFF